MTSPDSAVTWAVPEPGIMLVTLQRPPANALGPVIIEGLESALAEADRRGDIKILVIGSNIPGVFAAGADIKHMSNIDADSFTAYGDGLRSTLDRLTGTDYITVAAIEGLALGGGLELAIACHLRVAGRAAKLGLPEVKLGLIPGAGGTQRLPRLVGRGRALDIMLTARQVPAEEAHVMGLVDRLVEPGTAVEEALAVARGLCGMSQPALKAIVRTVDASFDTAIDEGFRYEIEQEQELFEHGEAQEGLAAFLGKRAPTFA